VGVWDVEPSEVTSALGAVVVRILSGSGLATSFRTGLASVAPGVKSGGAPHARIADKSDNPWRALVRELRQRTIVTTVMCQGQAVEVIPLQDRGQQCDGLAMRDDRRLLRGVL
jgi:hypothetical protein